MAGIRKNGSAWSEDIEKYSRQIWLAGLGAYAKIGEDGSKLFDALVKDGERAEHQVRSEIETLKSGARGRVADVRDKALGKWNALEDAFDKRLGGAIARLGVPSRQELKALNGKVEALSRQLERLSAPVLASHSPRPAETAPAASKPRKAASKAASGAAREVAADAPSKPRAQKSPALKAVRSPVMHDEAAQNPTVQPEAGGESAGDQAPST